MSRVTLPTREADNLAASGVCGRPNTMEPAFRSPSLEAGVSLVATHDEKTQRRRSGRWTVLATLVALVGMAAAYQMGRKQAAPSPAETAPQTPSVNVIRVQVATPKPGEIPRTVRQPGSVHVYNYANVFAKVSGYLQTLNVDIGSRVKKGDVLAVLYAPEIIEGRRQAAAELKQAQAQVLVMEAAVETAQADVKAAEAMVQQSQADLKRAEANLEYRQIDFNRESALFKQHAVEEVLVDESRKNLEAAIADKDLKEAAISTAKAQLAAKQARLTQANADVESAKAKVNVSKAALGKAEDYESYLTLRSDYNGVVTLRNFHEGDFVKAAEQGGQLPMLSVAETDLMRVVVQVDDKSAPYTFPGNDAVVTLDELPGETFKAKVARTADIIGGGTEDGTLEQVQNKTMRTEIDLPNPDGRIKGGMYGWVTIQLKIPPNAVESVTIPATCLTGTYEDGTDRVFVLQDGHAHGKRVKILHENGVDMTVSGIGPHERVISASSGSLYEGAPVEVIE
jgi:HlyD family secretion protein